MRVENIFSLEINNQEFCKKTKQMKIYLFVILNGNGYAKFAILPYGKLFDVLKKYYEKLKEAGRELSQKIVRDELHYHDQYNNDGCITHAAICDLPNSCLLSTYDDPLLILFHEISLIITNLLNYVMPNMNQPSVFDNSTGIKFNINQTACYWFAECSFLEFGAEEYIDELRDIGINELKEKAENILKETKYTNDSSVILGHASGNCILLDLSEWIEQIWPKTEEYIKRYEFLLSSSFNFNDFRNRHKKLFSTPFPEKLNVSQRIYIYIAPKGYFTIQAPGHHSYGYSFDLDTPYTSFFVDFSSRGKGFYSDILFQNQAESCEKLTTHCSELSLINKIRTSIMKQKTGMYSMGFKDMDFIFPNVSMPYEWFEMEFTSENNDTTEDVLNSSNSFNETMLGVNVQPEVNNSINISTENFEEQAKNKGHFTILVLLSIISILVTIGVLAAMCWYMKYYKYFLPGYSNQAEDSVGLVVTFRSSLND